MDKTKLPNLITALRIAGTAGLLFTLPLTPLYFAIYTLCGLSDVLDGWLARHTGTASDFGAKLDSIADLFLFTAVLIKLLPTMIIVVPLWLWWLAVAVLLLKIGSCGFSLSKFGGLHFLHTFANKAVGAVLFLVPYFISCEQIWVLAAVLAVWAAAEELIIMIKAKEINPDIKKIWQI